MDKIASRIDLARDEYIILLDITVRSSWPQEARTIRRVDSYDPSGLEVQYFSIARINIARAQSTRIHRRAQKVKLIPSINVL